MKKVCLSSIFLSTNFTISMTQLTRDAIERSEAKRAEFRYNYGLRFTAEQTVFVDESSFDRRTSLRTRAWALCGERASKRCFFVRGHRYVISVLNVVTFWLT